MGNHKRHSGIGYVVTLLYADEATAAYAYFMDYKMPDFSKRKWDQIVNNFMGKYEGLVRWHEQILQEVYRRGQLTGPTGRIWKFNKYEKKGVSDYSKAQIYNYPVQGTAGDVIKLAAIYVRKMIKRLELQAKPILTVHDSLIFDVPEKEVDILAKEVYNIFIRLPELLQKHYNWVVDIPIKGEIEVGYPSWGDKKEYHIKESV